MEPAGNPWRPLGTLLVERGLLSEADLERALEEQQRRGLKLGQTLVEMELVPAPMIKLALLEQMGLDMTQQVGFGSGLLDELERRGTRNATPPPRFRMAPEAAKVEPNGDVPVTENGNGAGPHPPRRRRLRMRRNRPAPTADPRLVALCDALEARAQAVESELDEVRKLLNELVAQTGSAEGL